MSGQRDGRSAPVRIGLIAGGPDGVALLQLLLGWTAAKVVVAVDPLPDALVLQQAKSRGIPAATRHLEVFGQLPVDLVIESTGQAAILDELLRKRPPGTRSHRRQEPPHPSRPAARLDREPRAAGGGRRDPPDHQQLPHRRAAGAGSRRRARRATLRRAGRGSLPGRGRGASPGRQDRTAPLLVDRRGRAHQPRLGDGAGRGRSETRPRARSLHVRRRVPSGCGLREAVRPPNRLATPLLREGMPIGAILLRGMELRPFTDKQIQLLETFAAQAVIAIENARLFKELGARNRDLTETLAQQTATSEILRVISSSPTDVRPVFEAIAQSAARLCEASDAHIWRREGDRLRVVASHGGLAALPAGARHRPPLGRRPRRDRPAPGPRGRPLRGRRHGVHRLARDEGARLPDDPRHPASPRRRAHRRHHDPSNRGSAILALGRWDSWKPSPTRPSSPSRTSASSRNWRSGIAT